MQVSLIRKNGRTWYFTDSTICGEDGSAVSAADADVTQSAALVELACRLCMNGSLVRTERDKRSPLPVLPGFRPLPLPGSGVGQMDQQARDRHAARQDGHTAWGSCQPIRTGPKAQDQEEGSAL